MIPGRPDSGGIAGYKNVHKGTMHPHLDIRVVNQLSEIERIHGLLEEFGATHSLPDSAIFALTLSLDEVLTNIISYGYEDAGVHEIDLGIDVNGGQVVVTVSDDARAFNPLEVPEPNLDVELEERRIGGLGIHLVRNFMNSLSYARENGRNILTLTKSIHDEL